MALKPLFLSLVCCALISCSSASETGDANAMRDGSAGGADGGPLDSRTNTGADARSADDAQSGAGDSGTNNDAESGGDAEIATDAGGGALTEAEVRSWVDAYKAAHPGNGGKDWDIIACCSGASRTEADLLNDPDAVRLRSICGPGQLPIIPLLAWEYGGRDHSWINPQASALAYCIYIPAQPNSAHWAYEPPPADHVTADVYVLFPNENPCRDQQGRFQVMACLGDATNIEILVDTASLHDGADIQVDLQNASTDLYLILPDGSRTHMYTGL